jgi:lipoprotein-anchoring transpeptidase ErfK/SrfK
VALEAVGLLPCDFGLARRGGWRVHGTPYASDRGQEVSHGCVRVYNPDMESLVDVPLGTPVVIAK